MKTLFFLLLTFVCFGCSSQTMVEQEQKQSPVLTASSQLLATPSPMPTNLPTTTESTYTATGVESKLGIVTGIDDRLGCLRIHNATLKASDEFYVIAAFEKPHEVNRFKVKEKVSKSCVDDDSDIGDNEQVISRTSYYLAELIPSEIEYPTWWSSIAVVGISKAPVLENGIATAELNGAPPAEYFRECASNEGMHFTVWSGKPLTGKRVWHRYFYLRYDTVPSCKKKDYEGTD